MLDWLENHPSRNHLSVDGTMVFVDVSGFTRLSERLARKGRIGAEELSGLISSCFSRLLADAYAEGGSLVKFGGDALLLLFNGDSHASRGCRAAHGMRRALRDIGSLPTSIGPVRLRMSVGVHSGTFAFFLVGDSHRELIVTGPGASGVVAMEAAASAGEIVLSPATTALLSPDVTGDPVGPGFLLRKAPPGLSAGVDTTEQRRVRAPLDACLPRAIRTRLGSAGMEPEHKRATVAFLHFDGLDRMLQDPDGEPIVAARLDALVRAVQAAADRFEVAFIGSDIDKDGGKIVLAAGAPISSENDEERVLLACREVIDAELDIPVRVGVNCGRVFAGDVGPSYRRTYTAMGDTVNLAARVMAKASAGDLLATDDVINGTARLAFELKPLEPFMVKGKSHPVTASLVGAPIRSTNSTPATETTPLVGRDRELQLLLSRLATATAGHGQHVEVKGEAGIGKSRLMAELRARATNCTVRSVLCEQFESGTPYFAARHLLRSALGIAAEATPSEAGDRLLVVVDEWAPDLRPWTPLMADVVGAIVPETIEASELDPKFRRLRLARAVCTLLSRTMAGPTAILVEDTHWMDEASGHLLVELSTTLPGMPWLLCTTRRDGSAGFAADPNLGFVTVLRPEPLSAEAATALVDASTDGRPLAPHEVDALAKRAGGNPLFLRELVAAARATDSVDQLPDSVEAVILSRIDRLPVADRAALKRLSVLGATFELGLAEDVLAGTPLPPRQLLRRLDGFLVSDVPGVARFRHALLRDAAYHALPFKVRQQLHAQAGEAIERQPREIADQAGVLSLHFFHAGRYDKAWQYSRAAAEHARGIYANVEAVEFFERAIQSAKRTPAVPSDEVAGALEALGDVRRRLGEYQAAIAAYREARARYDKDPSAESRILLKTGRVREVAGRYADALRWLRKALNSVAKLDDPGRATMTAQVTVAFAAVKYAQGRPADTIRWSEDAIRHAVEASDRDALAHAYYLLDAAYVALGRLDSANHSSRALALYEELGDLWGQGVVLNNLGGYAYWRGEWDAALELYERGRAARERIGDAVNASYGTINIAEILVDQGRLDEAEPLLRQVLRVWQAAGDRASIGYALGHLGRVAYRSGRTDEGLRLLEEALELSRDVGRQMDEIEIAGRIAECRIFAGDDRRALDEVTSAIERLKSVAGAGVHTAMLHRIRGFALLRLGRTAEAQAAFEISLEAARSRGVDFELALTLRPLAALAESSGWNAYELTRESERILTRLGVQRVFEPGFVVERAEATVLVPAQSGGQDDRPLESLS